MNELLTALLYRMCIPEQVVVKATTIRRIRSAHNNILLYFEDYQSSPTEENWNELVLIVKELREAIEDSDMILSAVSLFELWEHTVAFCYLLESEHSVGQISVRPISIVINAEKVSYTNITGVVIT